MPQAFAAIAAGLAFAAGLAQLTSV